MDAKDCLDLARKLFCENYSSAPLRSALKKGLSAYVQKIGS